jgi:hypothetical protein
VLHERLHDVATKILAAIEAEYATHDVELPARRYVAPAAAERVAHDCDQVTVALVAAGTRPLSGAGHPSPGWTFLVPVATYEAQIIRCIPAFDPADGIPSASELAALGEQMLRDAGLLLSALLTAIGAGALLPDDVPEPHRADVTAVVPVGPSGGLGGVLARVAVDLA